MTQNELLTWYHNNLLTDIQAALNANPNVIYTPSWLIAISMREVGFLMYEYVPRNMTVAEIMPHLIGDSGNGYGLCQIDKRSFPAFIESNGWLDPVQEFMQCIKVLEVMRKRLSVDVNMLSANLPAAITASYNCGEGNVIKALDEGKPVDAYTFGQNYSTNVLQMKADYEALFPAP